VHCSVDALKFAICSDIASVGYAPHAVSDAPKRTPQELWLQLEVGGSPWTSLDGSPGRIRSPS